MSEAYEKMSYLYRRWFQRTKVEPILDDVKNLFDKFAENQRLLSDCNLQEFLMEFQGEEQASASQTAKMAVKKSLKKSKTLGKEGLNLNGFSHFLLGNMNPALSQQMQEDELKYSLPHYFVQTTHHSYFKDQNIIQQMITTTHPTLEEEDHKISSSILMGIKKALKNSVRVIELDLYPNSDSTNVDVHNEWTTHSSERLSRCFEAIRENAFKTSEFPVIIILVEHINPNLQAKVATKIRKYFDRMLYSSDDAFTVPLDRLQRKFIILSRQPKQKPLASKKREQKPSEDYQNLIVGHIEDLDDQFPKLKDSETSHVRILRSTESLLENARCEDVVSFTQKNLLVVYPNPSPSDGEINSSNDDPFIGWARGAQMVAFDTQKTSDKLHKNLWIMQGLFRAYGGTGYVKKPDILLNKEEKFDPTVWRPVKKILKVKVYMGTGWHLDFGSKEFDSTSPPDFFAALEIVGVPEDEAREKTVPAMDEWIPTWNQEFEFTLTVPELAMLMIEVREFDPDRTHDFGGQTCLPVWLLRNGIRSVPLYTERGKPLRAARLLIHFQLD